MFHRNVCACSCACYYFLYLQEKKKKILLAFINILVGQGIKNTARDYNSQEPRAIPRHPNPPPPTHTLWLENKPCTRTNRESCGVVAPSYNIISFECFLRFIRQAAITILPFSIPPLEKRDNIYVTWQKVPNPLYVLSLMFSITFWRWRRGKEIMPKHITPHGGEGRCAPFV